MRSVLTLSAFSFLSIIIGAFFISKANFEGKFTERFGDNSNYNFSWTNSTKGTQKEEEGKVQVAGLKRLNIEMPSGEIKISPQVEGEKDLSYQIKFIGEKSPLKISQENGLLNIRFEFEDNSGSFKKDLELELFIPQTDIPLDFTADVNFGSMKLAPGLYFDTFNVDMSAGEMKTEALSFKKGEIELSAGEIDMKSTDLKNVDISVSGGSVDLEVINPSPVVTADVNAGELKFSTAEGIEKNFTLEAEVTMGDVDVVEGYKKDGDKYVFGKGEGRVDLEVDLGEVKVF